MTPLGIFAAALALIIVVGAGAVALNDWLERRR